MKSLPSALLWLFPNVHVALAQFDPWSYIVLADWHGSESFVRLNDSTVESDISYTASRTVFKSIKDKYGGDLILFPGDTQTGHWDRQKFRRKMLKWNPGLSKSSTTNEIISLAANNCHRATKKLFVEAGFDKTLFAVGDHEYGGNPWRVDSPKVNGLPSFRGPLVSHLNQDESDLFLYNERIGDADSRPIGTPYNSTSYAYVHKNALFITLDAFHQVSSDQPYFNKLLSSGGEGVITCTVTGKHLDWFESVLKEAKKDATIKHIFVQAHVPILQPVRRMDCSGQFFDRAKESELWKAMRKYGVDVYFAGEVHANTATKDASSNLLQVVSRGNRINNFLFIDVDENKFTVSSYNEVGPDWRWNGEYVKYGEIVVEKLSVNSTSIESSGSLQIIDIKSGPLIQFNFESDNLYPFQNKQIVGIKHDQFRKSLIGESITIRNEISTIGMENFGIFGQQYDAQVANLEIDDDNAIFGRGSGVFTGNTRVAINSMGPMGGGERISFSLFFKTSQADEMILVNYSGAFGIGVKKDIFLLTLKNGTPVLRFSRNKSLTTTNGQRLDDGVWHHLSVSMPSKSCRCAQVKISVDGQRLETELSGSNNFLFFITSGRVSLGGWGYSFDDYENAYPGVGNFVGKMDSFYLWGDMGEGPQIRRNSWRKNFDMNYGFKCNSTEARKYIGEHKAKTCKRKCARSKICWGYELKDKTGKMFQCYHFEGERPQVGDTSSGTQCNPVVS